MLLRRLVAAAAVLWLASILVFALSRASGDPRYLFISEYTTKEQWDAWGRKYGLDRPLVVQYGIWFSRAIRLDFGESLRDQVPAIDVIRAKVPATAQLGLGAFVFAITLGIPLGVFAALTRGTGWDLVGRGFALLGQAMPGFWLGIMLILTFSVRWQVLPPSGRAGLNSMILPSITLGWFAAAALLRLTRSSMLEVLDSEYIKLARAKGVASWKVVWKHAFRNALIVPMTYAGLLFAGLMTGAVVTETVFAWPGLGRLAVQAVFGTDFAVISAIVLIATALYLALNLCVDLLYGILDPRIRHG